MIPNIERPSGESLRALTEAMAPSDRVLSVYLNTSPGRVDNSGYLLAFRDACKQLRQSLPADEQEGFERAVLRAETYLTREASLGAPGLAIFVADGRSDFQALRLPISPADEVHWGERPFVEPVEAMLDDSERVAVVLFDKERTRLLSIAQGAIESEAQFEDEVPGKQRGGGWFALAQTRYARHQEEHVLRHVKRTVRALMTLLRTRPFDRLLLAGPDEALSMLEQHLPRPLRLRVTGRLQLELFAPDQAVLQAVLERAEQVEREEELTAVEALLDAATTPSAVLGLELTLAALSEGRAHALFIAGNLHRPGGECSQCGRLTLATAICPTCSGALERLEDIGERAVERALLQGAKVETVSGAAADRLNEQQGIGAWTRW